MSIKAKVSAFRAIEDAMDKMGLDETNLVPVFMEWAIKADKRIGSYYAYKKQIAVLDVVQCSAKLPCGAMIVRHVLLGDHGCDCGTIFDNAISTSIVTSPANSGLIVIDARSNELCWSAAANWVIQDNKLVFGTNMNGMKVTVDYVGYQLDEKGFPLINENHVEAIAQFIMFMYVQRSQFGKNPIKMNPAILEDEWHRLCRDARATDAELSEAERMDLARLIANPITGRAIEPMFLNGYY